LSKTAGTDGLGRRARMVLPSADGLGTNSFIDRQAAINRFIDDLFVVEDNQPALKAAIAEISAAFPIGGTATLLPLGRLTSPAPLPSTRATVASRRARSRPSAEVVPHLE
jgi:hypothetical protein